jgi:hypothetical protein
VSNRLGAQDYIAVAGFASNVFIVILALLAAVPVSSARAATSPAAFVTRFSKHHPTPTPTATHKPAATATATATPKPSATHTPKPSATPTPKPSATPTPKPSATATAKPTATPTPVLALWVENAWGEYVAEFSGPTLTTPGASVPNPTLINSSPDLRSPLGGDTAGVSFDASNNQWVTNCAGNTSNLGNISEFKLATLKNLRSNNAPAADVVLSDDGSGNLVNCPWGVTFRAGNLWAANSNQNTSPPGSVVEYLPSQFATSGHPVPHITLLDSTQFVSPTGVAFDSNGNLFVTDFGPAQFYRAGAGAIWVFKAATVASLSAGSNNKTADAKLSDPTTVTPVNGAFDASGNLWIADCQYLGGDGELYMFPKSALTVGATSAAVMFKPRTITTPNGTENSIDCPGGIAFDAQGNLWYTNFENLNSKIYGSVGEFTKNQLSTLGTSTPLPNIYLDANTSSGNIDAPIGLAFGPAL